MITRKDVALGDIFFKGVPLSLRKRPEGRWRTLCVRICSAYHVK